MPSWHVLGQIYLYVYLTSCQLHLESHTTYKQLTVWTIQTRSAWIILWGSFKVSTPHTPKYFVWQENQQPFFWPEVAIRNTFCGKRERRGKVYVSILAIGLGFSYSEGKSLCHQFLNSSTIQWVPCHLSHNYSCHTTKLTTHPLLWLSLKMYRTLPSIDTFTVGTKNMTEYLL